jgi:hypothetical protein
MSFKFPRNKDELLASTQSLPVDSFFLEHSRDREINYIHRSIGRWTEALGFVTARLANTEALSCLWFHRRVAKGRLHFFFLEVIEHVHQSPVDILKSLRGLLNPGGLLILSTPNMMCFANRVAMLFNKKLKSFTYPPFSLKDGAHWFGHDRIYMPAELRDYFVESGFQNVETLYPRHFDDLAHENFGLLGRVKSMVPAAAKSIFPSMRDGVALVGRQS